MQDCQNLSITSASSAAPMVPFLLTGDSFADAFDSIKMAVPALLKFESGDWNDMDNAILISPRAAQGLTNALAQLQNIQTIKKIRNRKLDVDTSSPPATKSKNS